MTPAEARNADAQAREAAEIAGARVYPSARPCRRGHEPAFRYVRGGACETCARDAARARYAALLEAHGRRPYAEVMRERRAAWRAFRACPVRRVAVDPAQAETAADLAVAFLAARFPSLADLPRFGRMARPTVLPGDAHATLIGRVHADDLPTLRTLVPSVHPEGFPA